MRSIAHMIDHTLLKPEATYEQIAQLAKEAEEYSFASICVNPSMVPLASRYLKHTEVKVCSVVGFPLGATLPEIKAFETTNVIQNGASEVDMVMNIGALKSGRYEDVRADIEAVVQATKTKALVKVIIETALLTDKEKKKACELAREANADFVKTSTGFSGGGATVEDVALMKKAVGDDLQVKASGGIRSREKAIAMIEAGADRIGTSSGMVICEGLEG